MKIIIISLFLFVLMVELRAEDRKSDQFSQIDLSEFECNQWRQPDSNRSQIQAWVAGYLKGLNMMYKKVQKVDVLRKMDSPDQAARFIDNFCRENPDVLVEEAANNFIRELKNK